MERHDWSRRLATDTSTQSRTVGDWAEIDDPRAVERRRLLYGLTSVVLFVALGLAVLDGFGVTQAYGVRSATESAIAGGTSLEVRYPAVTRPGLASPFEIIVGSAVDAGDTVSIAVSADYLEMWDTNAVRPTPSSETMLGDWIIWEFDAPPGDVLRVSFDARIEPAVQTSRGGDVAVLDDDFRPIVQVEFDTTVRP